MSERQVYIVTDLDRIGGGQFSDLAEAVATARELADRFPGNKIHILESRSIYFAERIKSGPVIDLLAEKP